MQMASIIGPRKLVVGLLGCLVLNASETTQVPRHPQGLYVIVGPNESYRPDRGRPDRRVFFSAVDVWGGIPSFWGSVSTAGAVLLFTDSGRA